jgi:hypothetical protein
MTTTEYAPGTVAMATVRGVKDQRVMRDDEGDWHTVKQIGDYGFHPANEVTDIRPLVVLDLEDPAETVRHLRAAYSPWDVVDHVADAIEAQTNPPRIPEPGLWGVVTARVDYTNDSPATRYKFVRTQPQLWIAERGGQYEWDDLIDPVLIREGIES